jgi:hypothetical protein
MMMQITALEIKEIIYESIISILEKLYDEDEGSTADLLKTAQLIKYSDEDRILWIAVDKKKIGYIKIGREWGNSDGKVISEFTQCSPRDFFMPAFDKDGKSTFRHAERDVILSIIELGE